MQIILEIKLLDISDGCCLAANIFCSMGAMDPPATPFQVALAHLLSGRGKQSWLARKIGMTPQAISAIINGASEGTQETRRKIVLALGYTYEDFLALGRQLLAGEVPQAPAIGTPALPTNRDWVELPPWDRSPLKPGERVLLQEALDVLRSADLPGEAGDGAGALTSNIKFFRYSVEMAGRPRCDRPDGKDNSPPQGKRRSGVAK